MKKKHGWVLQQSSGKFVDVELSVSTGVGLREAVLCGTRASARSLQLGDERVCKVSLTAKGKAKKIISGR